MRFMYSNSVSLNVKGVTAEELPTVLQQANCYGYGARLIGVRPELQYDDDGYPMRTIGTYTVEFGHSVGGCKNLEDLTNFLRESYTNVNEIEKELTK